MDCQWPTWWPLATSCFRSVHAQLQQEHLRRPPLHPEHPSGCLVPVLQGDQGSVISITRSVRVKFVCPPPQQSLQAAKAFSAPVGAPPNNMDMVDGVCVLQNKSTKQDAQERKCYDDAIKFFEFTLQVSVCAAASCISARCMPRGLLPSGSAVLLFCARWHLRAERPAVDQQGVVIRQQELEQHRACPCHHHVCDDAVCAVLCCSPLVAALNSRSAALIQTLARHSQGTASRCRT